MAATSSPSHYYSPDSAACDYHNGDLCRPYVSLFENNWRFTNFAAEVFNADSDAKDVSSICWHSKPANQSDTLNSL